MEVKASTNPFFQTTSSDIGARPEEMPKWKVGGKAPPFNASTHENDGTFAFLYTRESDRIGSKVAKPPMKDVKLLTKTEFLKKKREEVLATGEFDPDALAGAQEATGKPIFKAAAEDIINAYQHKPKQEDPRYTTSTVSFLYCAEGINQNLPIYFSAVVDFMKRTR